MKAVILSQYGTPEEALRLVEVAKPTPKASEVLVRIKATSVNPIECKARQGYGKRVFSKRRNNNGDTIFGNDITGIVEEVGTNVRHVSKGDEIISAPPISKSGSYCEYVTIDANYCVPKPKNLSFVQAGTIPYVAQTVWQALIVQTRLSPSDYHGLNVLVHGGSGGIGSFAIQLLKMWGATITTTCSSRNADYVRSLGATNVIDYHSQNFSDSGPIYDIVLDTIGDDYEGRSLTVLRRGGTCHYISLATPILSNTDKYGLTIGIIKSIFLLGLKKLSSKLKGINYHWCMFKPNPGGLSTIAKLYEQGHIFPKVCKTFALEQITEAHQYQESGKSVGKIGIRID